MSSAAEDRSGSLERSLQWTLGLLVLTALMSLTGAAAWIGRQGAEQFVAARLAHDAEALIAGLAPDAREIDRPLPPVYSQPFSGHYFVLRFRDGEILRSRSLWDQGLEVPALNPGQTLLGLQDGPQGQRLLLWHAGFEKQGLDFTVAVAEDLNPLLQLLRRFLWIGIGTSLLAAAALLLVQRRMLRRGFRRIDAVRADMRRIDAGEIDRLREDVPAEVRPLVRELNQLIGAWKAHLALSRHALGNLAHALKSPLNLILLHHPSVADDPVAEQALRMRGLIDRELRRARLAGDGAPGRRLRPHEDIGDLVEGIRTLYADKPLKIETHIDAPERLPLDQEDMLELMGNLLDNAAKWAQHRVQLTLDAGHGLHISVEDDGPGVAPEVAESLAARGSRLDEATPGHGLGLAIVDEIVRLHGGSLRLGRSQGLGGLAVRVDLPGSTAEGSARHLKAQGKD